MPRKSKTEQLALDKLATSGLTPEDAKLLGVEYINDCSKLNPKFQAVPGLKIPYFCPETGDPLSARPKWPEFYRLRYLAQDTTSFDSQTETKGQRYTQPAGTGVCAYFPMNQEDWADLIEDTDQPLIITEGELKAAKGCADGFPTIGLGGVFNFRSTQSAAPFLPELELVNWAQRYVYIIYDSDFRTNPHICQAINMLSEELMDRGAIPYYIGLPDVYEDELAKTGLDDFLVERSPADLRNLLHNQAQPLTLARNLWDLNSQVTYIENPGLVVIRETGQKMSPTAFKDHSSFGTAKYYEHTYDKNGNVKLKKMAAAPTWLKWEFRANVNHLTYAPGKDMIFEDDGTMAYNSWPGWGCEPKKGDVKPFLKLIDHLFKDAEPEFVQWFLRWCAYPIQHPGTKMFSSVVIHGVVHGTGKSLIGVTLSKVYGKNYTKINQKDLERDYNDWAENKQFVMGDEITGSNKRAEADFLKDLITQERVRINTKYVPIYEVPDCINYLFTSNHPDAFFLEDRDRRYAIHEVLVDALPDAFYKEYMAWLKSDGPSALFEYLQTHDLGTFNPSAPAYASAAKQRMIADSKSDLGAWCSLLAQAPDTLLKIGDIELEADLYSSKQLLELYDPMEKTRVSAQGMGTNLKKVGLRQVCNGAPLRVSGSQDRYYAVRNVEKWHKASPKQIVAHLEATKKVSKY